MVILGFIGILVLMAAIFGPRYWVAYTLKRYGQARRDFPGTGGELAEHLIDHYGINGVRVERTDKGDHYDPRDKCVRLSEQNYEGRSITAVAVAAHEVGHAVQHHQGDRLLSLRQLLVRTLAVTDMFASVFFVLAPILTIFIQSPAAFIGFVIVGLGFLAVRLVVHLITLPVEWDASFNKALPILEQGGYLEETDLPAAKKVLQAAAMTYVAAALASLLDITRWIRMLR